MMFHVNEETTNNFAVVHMVLEYKQLEAKIGA